MEAAEQGWKFKTKQVIFFDAQIKRYAWNLKRCKNCFWIVVIYLEFT